MAQSTERDQTVAPAAESFPPGWYRAGQELRWWDGGNWTPHTRPFPQTPQSTPEVSSEATKTTSRKFPHWRKMTWALIVWTVIMVTWMIGGSVSAQKGCDPNYQGACNTGTAIGVGLLIGLWFLGFVVLSLIWFMTRSKRSD